MAMVAIQTGDAASARAWLARVRQQVRIGPDAAAAISRAFRERFGAEPQFATPMRWRAAPRDPG